MRQELLVQRKMRNTQQSDPTFPSSTRGLGPWSFPAPPQPFIVCLRFIAYFRILKLFFPPCCIPVLPFGAYVPHELALTYPLRYLKPMSACSPFWRYGSSEAAFLAGFSVLTSLGVDSFPVYFVGPLREFDSFFSGDATSPLCSILGIAFSWVYYFLAF